MTRFLEAVDRWLDRHDHALTRVTTIGALVAIAYFAGSVALR